MISDTAFLAHDHVPASTPLKRGEAAASAPTPGAVAASVNAPAPDLGILRERFSALFQRIADTAAEREHTRTLAYAPILWLKDSGFTALRVPPQWGGSGVSIPVFFELFQDLAAADSNVAQILRPHFGFIDRLLIDRDAATQAHWLPLAGQGAVFGNATTETGVGAVGHLQTTLEPDAEHTGQWRLNGRKFYSTGTLYADWVIVVARSTTPGQADDVVNAIVPTELAGVERLDDWHGFGQRLTGSGTTVFTDVLVPESSIIRFPRQEPTPLVAYFQLVHLATLAGIARAVQRDAVTYVQARKRVFSHGSAALPKEDPLVQHIVGELASTAYIAYLAVNDVATHLQAIAEQRRAGVEVSRATLDALELRTAQAQVAVVEPVLRAATRLFDVGGSTALEESRRLDRHWRNARALASHNPVIYKARSVGDILLNEAEPVYYWHVGTKAN